MASRPIPGGSMLLLALLGGVAWFVYERAPKDASAGCHSAQIAVKQFSPAWRNPCTTTSCAHMTGVATIHNACQNPIGVEVRMTAFDAAGAPVATKSRWPASVSNIPVGDYTFSLDHFIDYDPRIKSFDIRIESVHRWR